MASSGRELAIPFYVCPAGCGRSPVSVRPRGVRRENDLRFIWIAPEPDRRRPGPGVRAADSDPAAGDPLGRPGAGPPGLRDDGERQDRRLPPPGEAPAAREAARQDALADP